MKQECTKCGQVKTLAEFYKDKQCRLGVAAACKDCERDRGRIYREANPEKEKERSRRYRAANPEKKKEDSRHYRQSHRKERREADRRYRQANKKKRAEDNRRWREANKKQIAQRIRRWRSEHPEKVREYARRWVRENPEKKRESDRRYNRENPGKGLVNSQRRRARKRNLPATLTLQEWEWLLKKAGHCCVYCLKHESEVGTLAQEHIIPLSQNGPYTLSNIVTACKSCNSAKGAQTPEGAGMPILIEISALDYCEKQLVLF